MRRRAAPPPPGPGRCRRVPGTLLALIALAALLPAVLALLAAGVGAAAPSVLGLSGPGAAAATMPPALAGPVALALLPAAHAVGDRVDLLRVTTPSAAGPWAAPSDASAAPRTLRL